MRYVMQDDPKQSPKATRLIEGRSNERPGLLPLVVVVELMWVLSSSYTKTTAQYRTLLRRHLQAAHAPLRSQLPTLQAAARARTSAVASPPRPQNRGPG